MDIDAIREHMDVVGSDGEHLGTVDAVDSDRIKLTRTDPDAGGEHRYVPLSLVERVGERVELSCSAEDARGMLSGETPSGLGERTGLSSAQL